jgi:hypothetical protein
MVHIHLVLIPFSCVCFQWHCTEIYCKHFTVLYYFAEPVKSLCEPGPCGSNADCYITENQETCYCKSGFKGDPYSGCVLEPANPCLPNPCGPNALCTVSPQGHPMCLCPDGLTGDPTGPAGCGGPECRTDDDCSNKLACIAYKCRDPCPGSCGIGASCRVEKHHPVCTCNHGLTGNPLIRCSPLPGNCYSYNHYLLDFISATYYSFSI